MRTKDPLNKLVEWRGREWIEGGVAASRAQKDEKDRQVVKRLVNASGKIEGSRAGRKAKIRKGSRRATYSQPSWSILRANSWGRTPAVRESLANAVPAW